MAEKKKAIHTGHRGRVKEEFLTRGIEGWPDHRVLELLLFYAIPQGDVNPLAHELIDRFGTLDGVLDVLPEELMKVKGMGEHSVVLLKLFPAVLGRYLEGRTGPGVIIHTAAEAGHVLAPYFYGARNEMVYILCLDAKERLQGVRRISEGNNSSSDVTIRRVAEECMALRSSFCYLAHNHVSGIALPSPEDMNTTSVVRAALEPLGVQLVDHLVFSDGDLVSLRESEAAGQKRGFQLVHPGQW
ncbi:JAB domain-containing protein [Flintibacter muris]|uniref:JAB domain-containing protein n=1 Tax=Flintibacter muris TaxID=2941327 RepID=UPI002040B9F8|nr:JAB domain-containing protein [Flintibacter muris]